MKSLTMLVEFEPEQTVYLLTDEEQRPRLVTGLYITTGTISYELSCGTQVSRHYGFEITAEKVYKSS